MRMDGARLEGKIPLHTGIYLPRRTLNHWSIGVKMHSPPHGNPPALPIIEMVPSRPTEFGPFQLRTQKETVPHTGEVEQVASLRRVISF